MDDDPHSHGYSRQGNRNGCTFTPITIHGYLAAMVGYDAQSKREAEAEMILVGRKERVEDFVDGSRSNTPPLIRNGNNDLIVDATSGDLDYSA